MRTGPLRRSPHPIGPAGRLKPLAVGIAERGQDAESTFMTFTELTSDSIVAGSLAEKRQ